MTDGDSVQHRRKVRYRSRVGAQRQVWRQILLVTSSMGAWYEQQAGNTYSIRLEALVRRATLSGIVTTGS